MIRFIFIALTLFLFQELSAQDKSLVNCDVENIGEVKAGDTINVRITLNLLPGWFIYAPTAGNKLQGAQVMNLKFHSIPNALRMLGEVKMPEPRLNKSYEVFMNEGNVFYQRFIVNETAAGTYNLTANLKYQACSSSICYPPITEKIEIPITVEKPVLPAKQVIQNATQQAKKENKNAFIMFHSSWCVWCRKMDTAMQDISCKKAFARNYVIEHLTVYEQDDKKNKENPGAEELLKKYQPPKSGIPFWLIFDGDGNLIADSQIRLPGVSLQEHGKNMGCPTSPKEIEFFIRVLERTSSMNEDELAAVAKVFSNIK